MITVRKLSSLPQRTRLRKIERVLASVETELTSGRSINTPYIISLLELLEQETVFAPWVYKSIRALETAIREPNREKPGSSLDYFVRCSSNIRHGMREHLGEEPAEWDLTDNKTGTLSREKRDILPFRVYLEDIRSPFNVGSVFRTAESFGVEKILLSPAAASPLHPRAQRSSMGCTAVVPWDTAPLAYLEKEDYLFALECGGCPVEEFSFPSQGTVIIGSEELGVSPEALSLSRKRQGIVTIPTAGAKASLNVSTAYAILMYTWWSAASHCNKV